LTVLLWGKGERETLVKSQDGEWVDSNYEKIRALKKTPLSSTRRGRGPGPLFTKKKN